MDGSENEVQRTRRARVAIFAVFATNGFLMGLWVVHIPTVQERTGVSHPTLGSLLLVLALGAIAGMQLSGPLADRIGSARMVAAAGTILAAAAVGPALASNAWQLGLALALFGFGNGALDVSMNAQAVLAERRYGRPIMSAFHALFSIGGVAGSLAGAAALGGALAPAATLGAGGAAGFVVVACATPSLLPSPRHHADTPPPGPRRRRPSGRVVALGALAFGLLLAEGAANDWSTLQVKEEFGASDATAAFAFGAFSTTMTLGRFAADRVSHTLGPVAVVRYGCALAAVGIALVATGLTLPLTLAGWALFGLGLSGGIPQIFTAAGNLQDGAPGTDMSRVVGMGYVGLLAGPALIGWSAHVIPLTLAMVIPLFCVLAASAGARIVRPRRAL